MNAARPDANAPAPPIRPVVGRLLIVAAALLWSSSGLFAKATIFADWPLEDRGTLLAFWRAVFAAGVLLPLVRRPRWNVRLVPMAAAFTGMNVTYLQALTLTTAANAIWLQSTAPLWVFVIGLALRQEPFDRRNLLPLACGLVGVGAILACELSRGEGTVATRWGVMNGLAAGVCYAGVAVSLRGLRHEDPVWLIALNHLVAAVVLAPFVLSTGPLPSGWQWAVLAAFGFVQMGLPYLLFARGLRHVSSQEGTLLALVEPVLMPCWVFLAWGEIPAVWTIGGGLLILAGLLVRYARPAAATDV